jgi:hypothetical protein
MISTHVLDRAGRTGAGRGANPRRTACSCDRGDRLQGRPGFLVQSLPISGRLSTDHRTSACRRMLYAADAPRPTAGDRLPGSAASHVLSLTSSCASEKQQAAEVNWIGWLHPSTTGPRATFRDALSELGYVEGKTIAFETRVADEKLDRLPGLAADLVRSRVDIVVATSNSAMRAAKEGGPT